MSHVTHSIAHGLLSVASGGLYDVAKGAKKSLTPDIPTIAATPTPEQEQTGEVQANLEAQRAAAAGQTRTILTSGLGAKDTVRRKRRLGGGTGSSELGL